LRQQPCTGAALVANGDRSGVAAVAAWLGRALLGRAGAAQAAFLQLDRPVPAALGAGAGCGGLVEAPVAYRTVRGAGTDGTGSAAHGAGAALRRRQQAMQIGWPLGRAATGRGLPQSVQVSAGRVAPWQRMHIGPASVRL
jgi:hypothetical protein